jgi:hypothetical protein
MSSDLNPDTRHEILSTTTSADYELRSSSDQPSREEMLEKLELDAVALLHRLETASEYIDLSRN